MARVNFFLVFQGRAGSGLLRAILNSSPSAVFEAEWMMFDLRKEHDPGGRQIGQIGRFFTDPRHEALSCLGFANKLSDIVAPPAFAAALEAHGARILDLKRRNPVKQVISNLNALRSREITGKAHAYSQGDILSDPFEIDCEHFAAHLRRLLERTAAQDRFVRQRNWPRIELFYEDLVNEREATVVRVAEFLEHSPGSIDLHPEAQPLKQTPTDLREVLTNFDALRERYRGTRFQAMIEDRRP
jgi:hypothetical protein